MEPRRYLRCLGQPALFSSTGEPIRFRTRKHLALLVYLAVETRQSHRRDRLGELLWPKVTLAEARHSLATALSVLRPRLGPAVLESTRDQVMLAPGRILLDLDRLTTGDILGSEVTGPLEVAAFLEGFDIPDSSEFTLWKDRQQARLLPAIKDALIVLIDRCRRTGDSRQIEHLADRMLGLDELSEEAIRAKMEARAFAGDRLTALKIFEEWKDQLAEELGAVPSTLVEGMAVRLRRRGWERTTLTDIPTVPTDQWRGRPFIGRSAEYRVLYEGWEGMRKGVPGHAMILGDSGVGKTTLVERLTTAAGLEGAAISRVQCYDLEREIPYATLGSLIHGLLDRPGVSATPPEALAELARTVPEVRRRFASIPPPVDSQGETARIRLTESFHQMLQAIAEEHPVILVVDDLHLADDASLAVLHLVMRRARGEAIMVVLIARPGELPGSLQAARLRESAIGLGIREVELNPLSEEDSRELLGSLVPAENPQPSPSVRRTLLRAAGGFPMVLELLVQDWQTNGDQSLALAVDAMTAELGGGQAPPAVYRQVLDGIVRAVDPVAHSVLNLAAILGHRLNDFGMYTLADLSVAQTMSGLAVLVRRRVLRDGGQGLEFVNELVRTAAYLGVPSSLRRILHSGIADRLLQEEARGMNELSLQIAWHCTRAGRTSEATPYLLLGARDALRRGAPYNADRALATAVPHLEGRDREDALMLLAEALQEQSRWQESLDVLGQATLAEDSIHADLLYVLTLIAQRRLAFLDPENLADIPPKLLNFIRTPGPSSSRVRAAVEAASVSNILRFRGLTGELLDATFALSLRELEADDRCRLLLARAMLLYNSRRYEESITEIEAGLALLEREGAANSVVARLYSGLGANYTAQGAYASAIPWLQQAYNISLRVGSDFTCEQAAGILALAHARIGDYEAALVWASRGYAVHGQGTREDLLIAADQGALIAHAMMGRATKVDELVLQKRDSIGHLHSPGMSQAWDLYTADAFLLIGRADEAEAVGRNATEGLNAELHIDFCAGSYARWKMRACLAKGTPATALEALRPVVDQLTEYDAVDQAEVLFAIVTLSSCLGIECEGPKDLLKNRLEMLPEAVHDQLRRLGMSDAFRLDVCARDWQKAN